MEGGRGTVALTATRMTAVLQAHLRAEGMSDHYDDSIRVGGSPSKSLAGTAVDEIMRTGGWNAEPVLQHGVTLEQQLLKVPRLRPHSESATGALSVSATAIHLTLSPAFQKYFSSCKPR